MDSCRFLEELVSRMTAILSIVEEIKLALLEEINNVPLLNGRAF